MSSLVISNATLNWPQPSFFVKNHDQIHPPATILFAIYCSIYSLLSPNDAYADAKLKLVSQLNYLLMNKSVT